LKHIECTNPRSHSIGEVILPFIFLLGSCSQKSAQATSVVPLPTEASKNTAAAAKPSAADANSAIVQEEHAKFHTAPQTPADDKNTEDKGINWKNMREDGGFREKKRMSLCKLS
jgi:hypothetical protein